MPKYRLRSLRGHASEILAQWKDNWFLLSDWDMESIEFEALQMYEWSLSEGNDVSRMFQDVVRDIADAKAQMAKGNPREAVRPLISAGLGMGVAMSKVGGVPKSPGPPRKDHWIKAERVFMAKMTNGVRVSKGTLWRDCKEFMLEAGIKQASFNTIFTRDKRPKWMKSFSGNVKG